MKRIYLFNIVTWNYRKKRGFPVCKKENFAGLEAHRKRGKSARASPTPHHTLNEERSARFTAQPLSALVCSSLGSTRGPRTARATRLWTPSAQRFAPRFALNKWIEAFDLYAFLWCALTIKLVKTDQLWRLIQVSNYYRLLQVLPISTPELFTRAFTKILWLLTVLLEAPGGTPDLNRSGRDDRLGKKSAKQISRASNETQKSPWTKI